MLKLLLCKKLILNKKGKKTPLFENPYDNPFLNRRSHVRYPIEHKHIKLINQKDIFLIKDLSLKGLNAIVSDRAYEFLKINDIYIAKLQYGRELYKLSIRVARKASSNVVGFEIIDADNKIINFLNRLIYPLEIAKSMKEIQTNFVKEDNFRMRWFHGNDNVDLFVWFDEHDNLIKWVFKTEYQYVKWQKHKTIETGSIQEKKDIKNLVNSSLILSSDMTIKDIKLNTSLITFAQDIIMAMKVDIKDKILVTLRTLKK